ncbi:fimbrillin family protein [uncultured Bacteroides sp.]|uniref:fimbrillin family protein n=1 Tax=uncultured Bacteroides sp. TaxID=162156 RepID=UPI0025CBC2AB|nr:fimbrillin family protein [uncultured Bacteroides sp.]
MNERLRQGISLWGMAAALILTAGCTNDNEGTDAPADGRVALQVTGGIHVQTRAHDTEWDKNDRIGIYMLKTGAETETVLEGVENIPYQTEAGDGKFAPFGTVIYFPIDGSNVDFRAWYPYEDVAEKWTADLTDQSSQAALDLMTAHAKSNTEPGGTTYNKNQPVVKLNFSHRLTKLVLNIIGGNGVGTDELAGLKVEITKQWKTALYDPDIDGIGFDEASATITLLTKADGKFAEAILFPDDLTHKSLTTGRQLMFTLSTGEMFYWDIPNEKSFNAGEKNIYNITINRTGLDVTASISDWNQGNGGGEPGSAE